MILCLVDLDICDKVLSPCQTEAFLTVQSLFVHLFFFPACNLQQCQTLFWVEENLQDLSSGISFHHLSVEDEEDDLRTWCQTCYTTLVEYPTALWGLLLNCILQAGAHCACYLPAVSQDDHQTCVSICTLVISHPLPEGLLLFLRSIAPIRLLSCS